MSQVLLFLLLSVTVASASLTTPPNIVLIVADDLGYNDIGAYGSPTIDTPNLNTLSQMSTIFTQFNNAAPICSPSRASLLTGKLPKRLGVYSDLDPPLDELLRVFYPSSVNCMSTNETTIASELKSSNKYETFHIGKSHTGHNNCLPGQGTYGIDFFWGLPYSHEEGYPGPSPEDIVFPPVPLYSNDIIVEQPFNVTDLTERYIQLSEYIIHRSRDPNYPLPNLDATTLSSLANLGPIAASSFFLHLAFENPHVPLFVAPDFQNTSKRGLYGDAVEEMDAGIGLILDALSATNQLDNTIIIFTSDNGAWLSPSNGLNDESVPPQDGGCNAPLRGGKGSTWEGGFRAPFIFKGTGGSSVGGQRITVPISGVDVFPTLLDFAGVGILDQQKRDGKSFRRLIDDDGNNDDPIHECLPYWRERDLYAVRCGAIKGHFITRSGFDFSDHGEQHDPPLLFNIENDPAEAFPLGAEDFEDELNAILDFADRHRKEMANDTAESLYLQQAVSVMPCCSVPSACNCKRK